MTDHLLSNLFDHDFYLAENNDVAEAGNSPLQHYLELGWREGRNPAQFFNESSYRIRYGLTDDDGPALAHFAENIEDRRFSSHPLIDRSHLLNNYDLDIHIPSMAWLLALPTEVSLHPLFDVPWMIHTYDDLGGISLNPCAHFLIWGEKEFRNPCANLDVPKIRAQLDALGASGQELEFPLTTFLTYGAVLSVQSNNLCDVEWAVAQQLSTSSAPKLTIDSLSTSCPMIDWDSFLEASRPHESISHQSALAAVGPLEYVTFVNHGLPKNVAMSLIQNYYS